MNVFLGLVLILSARGFGFGGDSFEVALKRETLKHTGAGRVEWTLTYAENKLLAKGKTAWEENEPDKVLSIPLPEVRLKTEARLEVGFYAANSGENPETARAVIRICPKDLFAGARAVLKENKILLLYPDDTLENILSENGIKVEAISGPQKIFGTDSKMLIVPQDRLPENRLEQGQLMSWVRSGGGLLVLASSCPEVMGYPTRRRLVPITGLVCREEHEVFCLLEKEKSKLLLPKAESEANWLCLPANEAALEIIWKKREIPGTDPVALEALLVAVSDGKGKMLVSQIRFENFKTDPRAHMFISGALSYLAANREPTMRPSERPKDKLWQK